MYMYHVCTIVCREHDDECYQVCGKFCHNWEKCLDKNIKILLTNIRIKKTLSDLQESYFFYCFLISVYRNT
jgi:hypothetical protein